MGVLVVRHGESTWNVAGRWQGQADPPLTPLGEQQAQVAAEALAGLGVRPERVLTSDLRRARATAEVLARALGGLPVQPDPRWRERDAGPWTGCTRADIDRDWPGLLDTGGRPPGFEDSGALARRALAALADAARRVADEGGVVVVVTHGGLLRAVEAEVGCPVRPVPNLAGRWFRPAPATTAPCGRPPAPPPGWPAGWAAAEAVALADGATDAGIAPTD